MVCMGFEPEAAGWYVKTKPQSYGGCPMLKFVLLALTLSSFKYFSSDTKIIKTFCLQKVFTAKDEAY